MKSVCAKHTYVTSIHLTGKEAWSWSCDGTDHQGSYPLHVQRPHEHTEGPQKIYSWTKDPRCLSRPRRECCLGRWSQNVTSDHINWTCRRGGWVWKLGQPSTTYISLAFLTSLYPSKSRRPSWEMMGKPREKVIRVWFTWGLAYQIIPRLAQTHSLEECRILFERVGLTGIKERFPPTPSWTPNRCVFSSLLP